ncbi:WhiB family transcriptional regulator [Streptomyces sparsogenes]|uniref:WhiB family transcriptional regulator n=1 Tax=Streptomyces sparsogenes TaxID=67365 RepID=UPI00384C52E3
MLIDPERRWRPQAACRGQPPGEYFADGGGTPDKSPSAVVQAVWDQAKATCRQCPVMHQCRRDTLGEEYGVWGGYDQHQRYLIRRALPKAAKRWPRQRRLAWGRVLAEYRDRDPAVPWIDIRLLTGIPQALAMELVKEYREYKAAEVAAAPVLSLPEPEARQGEPPFPDVRGRLDAWVRHNGLVADGYYQGETADGLWLLMNVRSGKSRARKWVRREDVKFHDPKPRFYIEYKERPDGPARKPAA